MSDRVKRYDLIQQGDYSQVEGVMTEVGNGDWIKAEDYDSLNEECERLRAIVKDATDCVKEALSNLSEV